jgi:hypothetical protein
MEAELEDWFFRVPLSKMGLWSKKFYFFCLFPKPLILNGKLTQVCIFAAVL